MADHEAHDVTYAEFDPPPALRAYVRCLWRLRSSTTLSVAPPPEPILPDGCVELVLHLGEPFSRYDACRRAERQPRQLLAGQITSAIVVQPSTTMNVWGIRFHPWSAGSFLGMPSVELRDRVVPLDELSRRLARALDPLVEQASDAAQLEYLVAVLSSHVSSIMPPHDRLNRVIAHVTTSSVDHTVRTLAKEIGLGARRVDALFREHVGLSPKQLLRIHRFQRALALRRAMPTLSWASIALRVGYYDQAHFVRDARSISGSAPNELLRNAGGLTEIFLSSDAMP
ncbi:MAG TPA: helix-turn-helix domain-containing protein [Gemmatimonadaceae bacterium]|jgi:methylphosphotriester-DNA--protein-cysteine methyltransferase